MISSGALYIGIMSGTSADGIDACLARFPRDRVEMFSHCHMPYPDSFRQRVLDVMQAADIERLSRIDVELADLYADAVHELLRNALISEREVRAIGCHGQTVLHRPHGDAPTSIQIGDPHRLAAHTTIDVISDFRRADIAAGGQGAPLAPYFHSVMFGDVRESRAVVNIGGMANITLLPTESRMVTGFDSGPGNVLIDDWYQRSNEGSLDYNGHWAATGTVDETLLARLRADAYFAEQPPKSTGREHFCPAWTDQHVAGLEIAAADVQATLTELTASTIADGIRRELPEVARVIVCGGGAYNDELMRRLSANLTSIPVEPSTEHGLKPDQVEAAAFAWLARRRIMGRPGNLPTVTGARRAVQLGSVVAAPH